MASTVIAVEWLNQNSLRNYPFREDCGLRPNDSAGNLISDGWRLPNYLIVDLVLGVTGAPYDPTLYLRRMSVMNNYVILTFADAAGEEAFTVSSEASNTNKPVSISGTGSYTGATGTIILGNTARLFEETHDGIYDFDISESLIEPTCIRPSAAGVRSIAVIDGGGYTTKGLVGDVKLVAGDNIHIKYDVSRNAIIVSADPNSGYTDGCDCNGEDLNVIRTINGISTENITIVGNDCIDVETEGNILKISDKCSKPCCGCAETAFINQTVNDLRSSVATLSANASALSNRITEFVDNYLLARKTLV